VLSFVFVSATSKWQYASDLDELLAVNRAISSSKGIPQHLGIGNAPLGSPRESGMCCCADLCYAALEI
jgi:hypothetical protein